MIDEKTTAQRAEWHRNMADMQQEESHRRADAMIQTRDALRLALDAANRSGVFAGQDLPQTPIEDADGPFGLIARALQIMGEGEALERFYDCAEWPQD